MQVHSDNLTLQGSEESDVCLKGQCENLRICLLSSVLIGHVWNCKEGIAQWEEKKNF